MTQSKLDPQQTEQTQPQDTAPVPKKKTGGILALVLVLAAVAVLAVLGGSLLTALRAGSLGGTDIRRALTGARAVCILAAGSAAVSVGTFFLRRQRKAVAAVSLALAVLAGGISAGGLYAYSFVFGEMNYDQQHNDLSGEELYAAGTNEDGEIIRGTVPADATRPADATLPTEEGYEEIEWVDYSYDQIPWDARQLLDSAPPARPSRLLEGSDQISMYMIFGLDKVNSSDAMILAAVDQAHEKIKLISFARDTYACYPMWGTDGYTRLAYPYTYGGATGELMAINYNFSLGIEDYISANFEQLVDIVDLIGGIEVDVDDYEYSKLAYRFDGIHLGVCHLDGDAALAYARIRRANDDGYFAGEVQRTGRQREVITAIMEKLRNMPLTEYPAFVRKCLGMVTTSLQQDEILDLALEVAQGNYTIESYALVDEIEHWQGTFGPYDFFYYVYDFNRASDWIYRTVYEEFYESGYDD